MQPVVTVNVWNKCQNACEYCVSHVPNRHIDRYDDGRDFGEVLDVSVLIRWLERYRPDARLHVSGGEPLWYKGIESWMGMLLAAGKNVTILTNGQSFSQRPGLHEAPVGWIITYHVSSGAPIEEYAKQFDILRGREKVVMRVLMRDDQDHNQLPEIKKALEGFVVQPLWVNREQQSMIDFGGLPVVKKAPSKIASTLLTLIENNGAVYPCGTKKIGSVGSIYDMTFDCAKAEQMDSRAEQCYAGAWCGACNTAILTNLWFSDA